MLSTTRGVADALPDQCHLDGRCLGGEFSRMETTLDYAETHFSQLLGVVADGEEVVLHRGTVPVARIVPIPTVSVVRPRVGERTSAPVLWSVAAFAPMNEDGMKELGLL